MTAARVRAVRCRESLRKVSRSIEEVLIQLTICDLTQPEFANSEPEQIG
jgi:hypothetical protein